MLFIANQVGVGVSVYKTSPILKRKSLHWWTLGSINLTKKDPKQF